MSFGQFGLITECSFLNCLWFRVPLQLLVFLRFVLFKSAKKKPNKPYFNVPMKPYKHFFNLDIESVTYLVSIHTGRKLNVYKTFGKVLDVLDVHVSVQLTCNVQTANKLWYFFTGKGNPVGNHMLKVNKTEIISTGWMCSQVTVKTPISATSIKCDFVYL